MPKGVYKIKITQEGIIFDKKKYQREWYQKHKDRLKPLNVEKQRRWRKNNPELSKIADRKKHIKHKERENRYSNEYQKKRRLKDLRFRLHKNISCLISRRLRLRFSNKGGIGGLVFLPYSIDDLIKYLEKSFKEGMSWANYGEWHIDHKIPDKVFNYVNVYDKEFQNCWALKNLQPLWKIDNCKKGASLTDIEKILEALR